MIEKIKIGLNNLYLFKNKNDEYLLLDTGVHVKKKKILKRIIQKIGEVKKIKVIVLSHSHADHVGNLKILIDAIGDVRVIAHRNSENVLETGRSVIPNGFYPFTEKVSKKLKSKKNFSKNIFPKLEKTDMEKVIFINFLQQERILLSEYSFGNMEIIETKGHSDDSVSLAVFDEKNNEKYLFCGDMVQNLCFKFPLIPLFGKNKEELIENWKKIILDDYDKIFPATGKQVTARDLIRRLGKDEKNRI
ncbi:MBL fold metallo-hydrolase [Leptotrichia sp. oral taxon 847]|uniref:MBL fold metallo-hydrolase n=1 Tax=Leptotrichia sp. oral taxon 847 TaxID=1785996 RepID=UPI00076835E6|nr:MBL fold metallo-hydrolase [Leptotrichia sp. oral taxon 847]AMD95877.1 MBL fold metallo-hydrolase [Leptotrichia sp. oral taxon 847]